MGSRNFEEWREHYEKERAEQMRVQRERMERETPKFREILLAAGAVKLVADYNGAGDSGCIEDIQLLDINDSSFPFEAGNFPNPKQFKDDLEQIFYDILQYRHSGWEINEGSYGTFTWDLIADTLSNKHNENVTSVNTTEHEGW